MSEAGDTGKGNPRPHSRARRIAVGGCCLLVIFFMLSMLMPTVSGIILGAPVLVTFGWIGFLTRVIPELEWNLSMIASSLIALTVAVIGFHTIARRLREGWQLRSSLACTGLVSVLFAAAIAVTGIFHQGVWLAKGDFVTYGYSRPYITNNINNVRQLVIGLRSFEADSDHLPESIYEMYPDYVDLDPSKDLGFWSFIDKQNSPHEWLYFPEAQNLPTDSDRRIVLASPVDIDGKHVVAFFGGNVGAMKKEPYLELLAAQQKALLEAGTAKE